MVIAYAESNFVCELVFAQGDADACAELLALARAGRIELAVPAFALVEPLWSVPNRARGNEERVKTLRPVLEDIARSRPLGDEARRLGDELKELLYRHKKAAEVNLARVRDEILDVATVLPMTSETVREARRCVAELSVTSYFDALMLASVLIDLRARGPGQKCFFLNRNTNDFNTPDVHRALRPCELIGSFRGGRERIRSLLGV